MRSEEGAVHLFPTGVTGKPARSLGSLVGRQPDDAGHGGEEAGHRSRDPDAVAEDIGPDNAGEDTRRGDRRPSVALRQLHRE